MKQLLSITTVLVLLASCGMPKRAVYGIEPSEYKYEAKTDYYVNDPITQSLFNDKNASISEENIQKILNGELKLPTKLRIAIVNLNSKHRNSYWNDEYYLKTQQAYIDMFTAQLKKSNRVQTVEIIPELLISKNYDFVSIREAAVRLQADVVLVYNITTDVYSNYKIFTKSDIKAFATTQSMLIDTRTGLVPFSTIATKDKLSQKKETDTDRSEAVRRIQNETIILTIEEIGTQLAAFLAKE